MVDQVKTKLGVTLGVQGQKGTAERCRGPSDYNKIENEICVRINAKKATFIPASSFFKNI